MSRKKAMPPTQSVKTVIPKTRNQNEYIESIENNIITIVTGPSGSGKSIIAIGKACEYLRLRECEQILLVRSIVGCGEIPALPGTIEEKIHPFMISYLDYFNYFLGETDTSSYIHRKKIKLLPVELLRGHTYNNTVMILEEAQNCTLLQLKLFMTRIGHGSSMIIAGDERQSDTKSNALTFCFNKFRNIDGVRSIFLTYDDIFRHEIIPDILRIFDDNGV